MTIPTPTLPTLARISLRHPLEVVICLLLVAMTAVVFAQVVARYIVQAPLSWSEELARFLLMWLSMLSAAYAFKTKSHFALRILVDRFPRKLRHTVSILVHAAGIFFFAVLLYFSIVFVAGVGGHIAPALQIPMEIPYASIVVGSAVVLIELLRSAWHELIGRGIKATD